MGQTVTIDNITSIDLIRLGHQTLLKFRSYGNNAVYEKHGSRTTIELNEDDLRVLHKLISERIEELKIAEPSCCSPSARYAASHPNYK